MIHHLDPNKTLAILIGIGEYVDFENIGPATRNATDLAGVLQDKSIVGIPKKNVHTILGGSSAEIKEQLFDLTGSARKNGISTLLLYFAGHGYRRTNGDYFLAAQDSKKRLLRVDGSTGIAYKTIQDIILESHIPQRIILLDACYSGQATQGEKTDIEGIDLKGSYTITASDGHEVAYFDTDQRYTLFTGELLNILSQGLPLQEEKVSLDKLYAALSVAVKSKNPKMSPQQKGSKEISGSNFLFFKNRKFDGRANLVEQFKKDLTNEIAEITSGNFRGAKRALVGLKADIKEQLPESESRTRLLYRIDTEIEVCKNIPRYKPYIEPSIRKEYQARLTDLEGKVGNLQEISQATAQLVKGTEEKLAAANAENGQHLKTIKELKEEIAKLEDQLLQSKERESEDKPFEEQRSLWKVLEKIGSEKLESKNVPRLAKLKQNNFTERLGSGAIDMIYVEGSSFLMGVAGSKRIGVSQKLADQEVAVEDFFMAKYPVTQGQWKAVMGRERSRFIKTKCDKCPVGGITEEDATAFIKKLNARTGKSYRLPSEAEWEYAARGGVMSMNYAYAGGNDLAKVGWFAGNAFLQIHHVGEKKANELGLYDMSGNVLELCEDHWHDSIAGVPKDGKARTIGGGIYRVSRGGSWSSSANNCKITYRRRTSVVDLGGDLGFRLALSKKVKSTGSMPTFVSL